LLEVKVAGFLNKFKAIRDSAKRLEKEDYLDREVIKGLLSEYNEVGGVFGSIAYELNLTCLQPKYISETLISTNAKAILKKIEIECEGVIGALERMISPLPKEDLDKISSLREQMKKLSAGLSDIYFEKNMEEAIKEYEYGHFLASALISGRVITYVLEQIQGESLQDKMKILQERGIISKDERTVWEAIAKADKLARNFFSHNIKAVPQPSDVLSLLGGSMKILELYVRYLGASPT